jgi:hypothetical protein
MGRYQYNGFIINRISHTIKRFKQRHGFFFTDNDIYKLSYQIIAGKSKFVLSLSRNYKIHKIKVHNIWVPVVYSKRHKILCSAYTNKWIGKKNNQYYIKPPKVKVERLKEDKVTWQLKNKRLKRNKVKM